MFEKRIASENSTVVDADFALLRRIFSKLGKDEASEFEIWQSAKSLGVPVPKNIGKYCSVSAKGVLTLKK
jgi:hypothetical protein